jgi:hypothetical protein
MLEVYYRYLPTFQHVAAVAPDTKPTGTAADDVVVDVR